MRRTDEIETDRFLFEVDARALEAVLALGGLALLALALVRRREHSVLAQRRNGALGLAGQLPV